MAHAYLNAQKAVRAWFCTKAVFNSRRAAAVALRRFRSLKTVGVEHGSGTMAVYKCKHCGMYHHGHK